MIISQSDIDSLDETSAEKLHFELCEESLKWNELAFQVYKHLRKLRRVREVRMGLLDRVVGRREKTLAEKLSEAANKQGIDLIALLNE